VDFQPLVKRRRAAGWRPAAFNDKVAFRPQPRHPWPDRGAAALERDLAAASKESWLPDGQFLSNSMFRAARQPRPGPEHGQLAGGRTEAFCSLSATHAFDLSLEMSRAGLALLGIGFLVVLPACLTGRWPVWIWWRPAGMKPKSS